MQLGAIDLMSDNIEPLSHALKDISAKTAMSYSNDNRKTFGILLGYNNTIMQSPGSTVIITVNWRVGRQLAIIEIERTCIGDDFEPWEPYWSAVVKQLRVYGYRVREIRATH